MATRSRSVICCATLVVATLCTDTEGGERQLSVHLTGGWSYSRTVDGRLTLGEIFIDGGAGGIGVAYPLGGRFEALADFEYGRLAFDPATRVRHSSRLSGFFLPAERGARLASLDIAGRARYPSGRTSPMSVYLVAGGGPTRVSYDVLVTQWLVGSPERVIPIAFRDTAPSLVGGFGADLNIGSRVALGGELRYRRVFTNTQRIFGLGIDDARQWTVRMIASIHLGRTPVRTQ